MQESDTNTQSKNRIYLDYAASVPVRPEIQSVVMDSLSAHANPSSIHEEGVRVRLRIEKARKRIALLLGVLPEEIFFTSGSTESLNIALRGIALSPRAGAGRNIVTSTIEHPAILETATSLEREGVGVHYLNPDISGFVSPDELASSLTPETLFCAFSHVNGEVGTTAPLEAYGKALRSFRRHNTGTKYPLLLVDATQSPLYTPLNIPKMSADVLVLDGSKIGGLRGAGVVYINRDIEIAPILFGGGQEGGLRPGTQNLLGIEAFAEALSLAQGEVRDSSEKVRELTEYFIHELTALNPNIVINGDRGRRSPHIVSVCFRGVDAEWLVLRLDAAGISVSRGSACKSGKGNESEVMRVLNPDCKESSIRFSFHPRTTSGEVDTTIKTLERLLTPGADLI